MENKVCFIINRFSGTGFRTSVEGSIIKHCAALNLEATITYTNHRGHATELAKDAVRAGYPRVFAMGGDGTVNEVAQGLVNTSVWMGILPKGSGNGLARHLGIPVTLEAALKLLGQYQVINMDTLRVNNLLSVNISGIGFDAHIAAQFNQHGKRGLFTYSKLVLQEFLSYKEFDATLHVDHTMYSRTPFVIAFANSSQFGNNARVAPFASVCDELIDLCILRKVPIAQAAGFAQKLFSGQMHRSQYVEIMQARKVSIAFSSPMPYHIDGESMPPTDSFEVTVKPGSLKMIVPDSPGKHL
jgi:YegS/Rv2252/BmrU family lipid kinase